MKYEQIRIRKMQNDDLFSGKKYVKLAHEQNFAPKLFPKMKGLVPIEKPTSNPFVLSMVM